MLQINIRQDHTTRKFQVKVRPHSARIVQSMELINKWHELKAVRRVFFNEASKFAERIVREFYYSLLNQTKEQTKNEEQHDEDAGN